MNTQTQIDDAIMLISIGDQLSQRFELADTQRKSIETRIEEITRWLPMDRSWDSIRSSLQIAAARCEVKLVAVDRANAHDGIRVSVFDARCEIQGTYQNICQFLHQIASQSMPMWCDEIRIVPGGQSSHTPEGESLICFATVSLRIPYAGNDTTAAKLLQGKSGNES